MKRSSADYRVAVVPVRLNGASYTAAHQACHRAAGLWNHTLAALRTRWDEVKTDPTTKELRHLAAASDPDLQRLHAHTKQAIVDDLLDAVATSRANRGAGTRAPWREKNYRPLSFTKGYGWRITGDGRLNLSLGRNLPGIRLALPAVTDSRTNHGVPAADWGEIRLCWDRDGRSWSLHISHRTAATPVLDPANIIAIDPGIINPMTIAVETPDAYEITVINGRAARAIKHRRNNAVADLHRLMSRCTKGSRQWRRYNQAAKHARAHANSSLRNIDHQVSRKAAGIAITHNVRTIAVGDVRGIEKNTAKAEKRRFGKDQRRRLSQWSRGRQDHYLAHKTGSKPTYTNESHSSKTCPACLTRNAPSGRDYRCHHCGFTCHRDAVGALNILMRATHGKYTPIDPDKTIRVLYLRATPLRAALSKARNRATPRTGCVAENTVSHAAAAGPRAPAGEHSVAA
ncbi:RNA-guided endonuclease InsQ/TnpB family protein (plasmid) [Pseudarthrobacter sp. P1]|uniref:RNA-guided endonuclease InsQ/TnpB family protein n=1 Tax=Pseudarthrobacter sp. P1 TaxID=3418418 RepID=UPI003CF65652